MKFFQSKTAAYLTDAFCAWLLSAALNLVLLSFFGFRATFGQCLLVMLVALALVFAFSRNWWILPAVVAFGFILTFAIASLLGTAQTLWFGLSEFFGWCIAGLPETSRFALPVNYFIVQMIAALPIAALSLLFFRKLFVFALLLPVVLGILFWLYFYYGAEFYLVLAFMFVLLFMSLAKMIARRVNRKLAALEKIRPALLPITALLLTAVVLILAFAFAPKDNGKWRVVKFVNAVQDVRDLLDSDTGDGPFQGDSGLKDSGFSPFRARLGGNISPNDTVVMKVTTETPAFLTGAVFSVYDGKSWSRADSLRRFRLESNLWRDKRSEIFSTGKPAGGRQAQALYSEITLPAEYRITYDELGRTLFFTGRVTAIESPQFDFSEVYFNSQGELFIAIPQKRLRYTLTTTIFDIEARDYDQNMLALEAETLTAKDPYLAGVRNEYLALPDTLPNSVYQTAAEITAGYNTPYAKAKAIRNWLKSTCVYTLSPGEPPAYTDFVAHFLETRKGYCEYYASAMTILARCADLPARYVAGYALKKNPDIVSDDAYIATNATAHAWTEVYFQGIGWVPFDATGWNFEEEGVIGTFNDGPVSESLQAPPLPADEETNDADFQEGKGMPLSLRILLLLLAAGIAAAAVLALVRLSRFTSDAQGLYRRVTRRYPDIRQRVNLCYRRVVKQAAFLAAPQQSGETISQYTARIDRTLGSKGMSKACKSVLLMRFALVEPTDDDLLRLCQFSAALEKRLRAELGLAGYLWRRLLIGK